MRMTVRRVRKLVRERDLGALSKVLHGDHQALQEAQERVAAEVRQRTQALPATAWAVTHQAEGGSS